ncbi:MAG: GtrA family protein [Novosphingobium sp.]|jgi:putative flippase GtrA|nr:GtrA family protein [Novosphingobium sp.]
MTLTVPQRIGEIARFLTVGLASAAASTLIIVGFTETLGISYLLSALMTFVLVNLIGFLLNRGWSFRTDGRMHIAELLRYYFICLLTLGLGLALSEGMVGLGLPYYIAVFLGAVLVAPVNYIAHRLFSFKLGTGALPSKG